MTTRKSAIVVQTIGNQIISIARNETPAIYQNSIPLKDYGCAIVNFLRAGCPAVQFVLPEEDNFAKARIQNLLRLFGTSEESFNVHEEMKNQIFMITRKI